MLYSKKALSPLIAAVLLIVVVVGIGAVVTGMMRGLVSDNQKTISQKDDEMACARDVNVKIVTIDGNPQFCRDAATSEIVAVVENAGTDVDDFQLMVYGDSGFYKNESIGSGNIAQGAAAELRGYYDSGDTGAITQAKFVPKLKKTGSSGYNFCHDVTVKSEVIPNCD